MNCSVWQDKRAICVYKMGGEFLFVGFLFFCLFVVWGFLVCFAKIIDFCWLNCSDIHIVLDLLLFFCTSCFAFLKPIPASSFCASNREQHSARQVNRWVVKLWCFCSVPSISFDRLFSMENTMLTRVYDCNKTSCNAAYMSSLPIVFLNL